MELVSVKDFRDKSAKVWKSLKDQREIVITSNGKPIAILSATDSERVEESLACIRKAKALQAVGELQLDSIQSGKSKKIGLAEINAEIKKVRQSRADS